MALVLRLLRPACLGAITLVLATGMVVAAACSSSGPSSTVTGGDGPATEPAPPHAPSVADASTRDGGHCTPVKGDCDLVLQDCVADEKGQKRECVVVGAGSDLMTGCIPVQASQQLPMGRACCPPENG